MIRQTRKTVLLDKIMSSQLRITGNISQSFYVFSWSYGLNDFSILNGKFISIWNLTWKRNELTNASTWWIQNCDHPLLTILCYELVNDEFDFVSDEFNIFNFYSTKITRIQLKMMNLIGLLFNCAFRFASSTASWFISIPITCLTL